MSALSSSLLALLDERCGRALDHAEDHAPRDADVFATGTSAHACLDAAHQEIRRLGRPLERHEARDICYRTAAALATVGRVFQGHAEPPLPLAATSAGASIALWHLQTEGFALPLGALPEHGLAVDRDWRPVPYDSPRAHYRAILDVVGLAPDEYGRLAAYSRDYKTAWTAGEHLLDSVQMRGQTLVLIAHAEALFGEAPEVVRREIVALRTGAIHTAEVDLGGIDADVLDDWRAEIDALVAAVPQRGPDGKRAASPGPRCAGCSYRRICDAADPDAAGDTHTLAMRQAALLAQAKALEPVLREATADQPLEVEGGTVLGWHIEGRREVAPEAADALAELYAPGVELHPGHRTLLDKVLTAGGVAKALKMLRGPQGRERREELEQTLLTTRSQRRWGWKKPPTAAEAENQPLDEESAA